MNQEGRDKSVLMTGSSTGHIDGINPGMLDSHKRNRGKKYTVDEYVEGIMVGNRTVLSRAITLVESSLPEHFETAQEIIGRCLPYSAKSIRIGITGVPGAGKSTFIETFGFLIAEKGRKIAVLTIDPSSQHTKGSILGDKTRMEKLGSHPNAFIRPSPTAGTFGGVARKTRETIILCEAAGFDTVLIETVGVGQSETAVSSMVDLFLLLMLAGAGDELQGIKRGIMEMADLIAITKADGDNRIVAEGAKILYQNALQLFPLKTSGWKPRVLTCSSKQNLGINEIWDAILEYFSMTVKSGYYEEHRREQAVIRTHDTIREYLNNSFYNHSEVRHLWPEIEKQLYDGAITSYKAAFQLLDKYFKK
jgi:LAO/AO transport system kinase